MRPRFRPIVRLVPIVMLALSFACSGASTRVIDLVRQSQGQMLDRQGKPANADWMREFGVTTFGQFLNVPNYTDSVEWSASEPPRSSQPWDVTAQVRQKDIPGSFIWRFKVDPEAGTWSLAAVTREGPASIQPPYTDGSTFALDTTDAIILHFENMWLFTQTQIEIPR